MKVFISYDRDDVEIANKISDELKLLDVDFFQDVKDISWGDDFREKIKQTFQESITHLIVILSPASLKSQWVAYEIGYADANGIKILPFLSHPAIDPPTFMNGLTYITTKDDLKKSFAKWLIPLAIEPVELSLKRYFQFSYPDNKRSISIQEPVSKNHIGCVIDFSDHNVDYAGCAINLCNEDWTRYILNGCSLHCSVQLKNIERLKIEIKGKGKEIIGSKYVDPSDKNVVIDLREMDDAPKRWKEMTEIVFLVEKENIGETGEFSVSNLTVFN